MGKITLIFLPVKMYSILQEMKVVWEFISNTLIVSLTGLLS